MEKVIEVNNLCYSYKENKILNNVSFDLIKGDFAGVIGSNGSGKSTLMKLLLRILTPISGEIKLLGESIGSFNKWYKVGYISQKANSFNTGFPATVEEVVGANLFSRVGLFKRLDKYHKEQIDNALELVDMQEYKGRLIGNLSGGQQQRVFIARVLISQPEIMFLDEPTVGVDARSEEAVYCLLARLNKELGITIVMVTHDISAITVHANKLLCIDNNGLSVHGTGTGLDEKELSMLYGYNIGLQGKRHICKDCHRRGVG